MFKSFCFTECVNFLWLKILGGGGNSHFGKVSFVTLRCIYLNNYKIYSSEIYYTASYMFPVSSDFLSACLIYEVVKSLNIFLS
jgi:hypothetical protein